MASVASLLAQVQGLLVQAEKRTARRRELTGPPLRERLTALTHAEWKAWQARTSPDQAWLDVLAGADPLSNLPPWNGITANMSVDESMNMYQTLLRG